MTGAMFSDTIGLSMLIETKEEEEEEEEEENINIVESST
jgi:hypothetical protein